MTRLRDRIYRSAPARMGVAALGFVLIGAPTAGPASVRSSSGEGPALRCSKRPFPMPKGDQTSFFVGTITTDSLHVGPGAIEVNGSGAGHSPARTRESRYMGLVVSVERGHSRHPAFPADGGSLVLVPWDYDAACRTLPWRGPAQFLPPGHRGFFEVSLRDRAHWVEGRPTADVFNVGVAGYPGPGRTGAVLAVDPGGDDPLTPDQLLAIYEAAPWRSDVEERGPEALGPIRSWAEHADSAVATSVTVTLMVRSIRRAADSWEVRRIQPEMAGTWRLDVVLPSGQRIEHFIRTGDTPSSPTAVTHRLPPLQGPGGDRPTPVSAIDWLDATSTGFTLPFWHAATVTALRSDSSSGSREDAAMWGFDIAREGQMVNGERVWIAHVEAREWSRILDHPELIQFADDFRAGYRAGREAGEIDGAETRFILSADGGFRMEGRWRAGGDTLRVFGERVSEASVPVRH